MCPSLAKAAFVTGLLTTLLASPPQVTADEVNNDGSELTAQAQSIPEELKDFSGMLIGKLVNRDIERGSFTVKVDYVARVWENNKSPRPRAAVGKTLRVDGVTGKWLDQLLLVRPGETLEFEAQHRGGDSLTFPGEWLKKVPAFVASEHPVPPERFRGFAGVVTGRIDKKTQTSRELILRIESIGEKFKRNKAKSPEEVIGKQIVLAGFWARMSDPFDKFEKGDTIRAGVLHRVPQSDHFTVIEFAEKVTASPAASDQASAKGFPSGMRGFRGILRGKLVSRDVEKGELVFRADRATRTWKQNRATDVASCKGKEFHVKGISGKWLDVLITLEPGNAIEVEAFHNGGVHLDFVSEWLKKVE